MRRETIFSILEYLFRHLTRYQVLGGENVPTEGAFILATNHMSRIDTPFLMIATPRDDIIALVADKYRFNPLFQFLVIQTGSIWIDREKADFSAFRAALQHLRKGGVLGIAPEGTRSRVGSLIEGKSGAALLADKSQVPILPTAISGTEVVMEGIRALRRPQIQVRFGAPFTLPPIDRNDREGSLQANTEEIMCRIAALLPAKYHGFYANHPRLQELLAEEKAPAG